MNLLEQTTTQELFDEMVSRFDSIIVIHATRKDQNKAKVYAKTDTGCECPYELIEALDLLHDGAVALTCDSFEE